MYQALYRKYRPATFSQVSGQEHVTETLKNELKMGRISHAYLFTGSRGTGKTSCAHILAKAVNCLSTADGDPCLECESCKGIAAGDVMDIMEIDAASNNGVDNIRTLREQAQFTPERSKYRVYIIDEVHMLSSGAFNALLKTLEEPPEHVIFILATTEVHKLPATVLSRCQRFDFKRIDNSDIAKRLLYVAQCENISLTAEAADLIAVLSDGGLRDALSILDQCAGQTADITEEKVREICGMAGREYQTAIAQGIIEKDAGKALQVVEQLHSASVDATRLCSEMLSHFRDLMLIKSIKDAKSMVVCSDGEYAALKAQADALSGSEIFAAMNCLRSASDRMAKGNRRLELEMAVIELCGNVVASPAAAPAAVPKKAAPVAAAPVSAAPAVSAADSSELPPWEMQPVAAQPSPDPAYASAPEQPAPVPKKQAAPPAGSFDKWGEVLAELSRTCPLLCGFLTESAAYVDGDYLLIDCANPAFRDMIKSDNPLYKDSIRKAAQKVSGKIFKLGPYTKRKAAESDPFAELVDKLSDMEIPQKY
ncbi:MAG: DNA polymerase III subunit gamma/tau [Clostridia bacterium]|nr:DNA polymerase III subunit gamma/tau [Clostridia bacterium]